MGKKDKSSKSKRKRSSDSDEVSSLASNEDERQSAHKKAKHKHDSGEEDDDSDQSSSKKKSKKHKKKKSKETKKSKKKSHSRKERSSPDFSGVKLALHDVLVFYPKLTKDLIALFESLDSGGAVVLVGVEDVKLKHLLQALFSHLNLEDCESGGKPGYLLHKNSDRLSTRIQELIEDVMKEIEAAPSSTPSAVAVEGPRPSTDVNNTVSGGEVGDLEEIGPTMPRPPRAIIGPAFPPSHAPVMRAPMPYDEVEAEIGPSMPGTAVSLHAVRAGEAMAKLLEEEKIKQWNALRGIADTGDGERKRESWMTDIPTAGAAASELGALLPTQNKSQFNRSKNIIAGPVDNSSWTESPAERLMKQKAKAEEEFLGYSTLPSASSGKSSGSAMVAAGGGNPLAAAEMTELFDAYNEKFRSKSLYDKHQESLRSGHAPDTKGKPKSKEQALAPNFTWDRDRDLLGGKQVGTDRVKEMVRNSGDIASRFTKAGTATRFI